MKKNTLQKMMLAATLLTLVSCTQDELMKQSTALPDGVYPITFTAVQALPEETPDGVPQTRVTDNGNVSSWTAGDQIKVTVSGGGKTQETLCTMNANSTISTYNPQLYWQTTGEHTINAWYSNISTQSTETDERKNVSLADQSKGLAYVLKADTKTANYQTSATEMKLLFKHQLAKVWVKVNKDTYTGNLNNLSVTMQGCYTSCTVTNGTISNPQESGEIEMRSVGNNVFEANVVPGKTLKDNAFKITADGKTSFASLNSAVTLTAGSMHSITINIDATGPKPITPGESITRPGDYIMTGSSTEGVTLNGDNINLIIEGVTNTANTAIHVKGGTPTITVKGTNNSFKCNNTPILLDKDANVIIKGSTNSPADSKLTISATKDTDPGIGSANGSSCGNISIANITLDVSGGTGKYGGAAIGTNGYVGSSCGNIRIENSVVDAKGGLGAAAIGLANAVNSISCGEIVIRYSKIYATTIYDDYYKCYAACIGHASYAERTPLTVGKITITTDESAAVFFGADRFKAIDVNKNEVTTGFYKVGKSTEGKFQSLQTWEGVYFGKEGQEKELASGSSNGYQ